MLSCGLLESPVYFLGSKVPILHANGADNDAQQEDPSKPIWWWFYDCFSRQRTFLTDDLHFTSSLWALLWGNGCYFLKEEELFLGDVPWAKSDLIFCSFLLPDVMAAWRLRDIISKMVSGSSQHIFPNWQQRARGLHSLQLAPHNINGKKTFISWETLKIRGGKEQTFQYFSGVMNY